MPQPQSFKNHTRFFPPFHFFVMPVLLINVLNSMRHVWNRPMRDTWFELLIAFTLFMMALTSRVQAVTVQDRVIRLEMRLRLRDVLPADLLPRIGELSRQQLVALRFASDGELPGLVREVLGGRLSTPRAIKEQVKDWQADHLRA